jgi:AraC family transcriptional regulator, regulatory protein of adaptative response / methylated-DNA-[protein]-cysteine methyltransferase
LALIKRVKKIVLPFINSTSVTDQQTINYKRIADAINYIQIHFKDQPNLDEVAEKINLSPFHFQRLFTDWAGTSPKKFLQYISVQYAKNLLKDKQTTLFDATIETGLSSTSRLHDLFVKIEGMTPAEYKNDGENLQITYCFFTTLFGEVIIANTQKGICYLAFYEDKKSAILNMTERFCKANFEEKRNGMQEEALSIFSFDNKNLSQIKLHLKGTDFQLKVWEALLKIPLGKLSTYGSLANDIDSPLASRAVGTAIGSNPVAFLIPCHRVIQSTGTFGGYRWGPVRKTAMIGWEAAKIEE